MATVDKNFKIKNGLIVGDSTNLVNYTSASPFDPFVGQLWISASSLYAWSSASTWVLIGDGKTSEFVSTLKHEVKAAEPVIKGQAVYVSSATGNNMLVSKASNTTEGMSSKTLGLIDSTLSTNDIGYVVTEGLLSGLNTNSATIGDPVWLGTSGSLIFGLVNKPVAPNHLVYLGIVTRVNQNNGEIFVHVQNGFELQELHNVLIQTASSNQILSYNSASSLWMNKDLQAAIKEVDGTGSGIDADLLDGHDSNYFAPSSSATFTGYVNVPEPLNDSNAATKKYVDDTLGGQAVVVSSASAYPSSATQHSLFFNTFSERMAIRVGSVWKEFAFVSDEPLGDGGDSSTLVFAASIDAGDSSTTSFVNNYDGGPS